MADVQIIYRTPKLFSVVGCEEVGLCLDDSWSAKTVSGAPFIKATVLNNGRPIGYFDLDTIWENVRGNDLYQFSLVYDNTQITNPSVDIVTCAEITGLLDSCLVDKLIDIYETQTPWVDGVGVTYLETLTDNVGIGMDDPISSLDLKGGLTGSVNSVVLDHLVTLDDRIVVADATAGNVVVSLPTAASAYNATSDTGFIVTIKRSAADASGNTVTIDANGTETIDNTDVPISLAAGEYRTIVSDGTQWHVIG